ncbi:hypothetical protein [Hymenobacter cheonanensis]|uniref:hypothetical protein n=1 Tax=Hymenobacter sp. CA2-7 TaxID=3063993 RepID=UPI002712EA7C|nr:hypothetical protein [Hymenobacter sp. CA2-7]MDO7884244.1 hypothetical protein [Hymenobacter sp. CA2-7]
MRLRSLVLLLLGALSCAKPQDPVPASNGSYTLDGVLRRCQATTSTYTNTFYGGQTKDVLLVHLTTVPQPESGAECLELTYFKDGRQPSTAYQPVNTGILWVRNHGYRYTFDNATTSLTATSTGFSGTYAGKIIGDPDPYAAIADGVFTDARPE